MQLRMGLLVLVIFILSTKAVAFENCGLIQKRTLGYKASSVKSNGVILNKNIIVPIVGETGSFYKVQYSGFEYLVKKNVIKKGSSKLCAIEYKCFQVKEETSVYRLPNQRSPQVRTHKAKDELNWVATTRASTLKGKKGWFQVISEGEYVWIASTAGKLKEGACTKAEGERSFFVGADYNYTLSTSADHYSYILTSVPNPSSVACLQNPIVSGVEPGQGHRLGMNVMYRFLSWMNLGVGVDFESITYKVKTLDNPHPDPGNTSCALIDVDISSLQAGSFTVKEQNVVVPVGLIFPFRLGENHHIFLAGHINSVINLAQEQSFDFFTGQTLSKQTLNTQKIGVNSFRTNFDVELKYIYRLPLRNKDTMGFTLTTKKQMDAFSIGLGIIL